ncbi:MAG: polysaccharide lyase [Dermatophilaceae bacterium]
MTPLFAVAAAASIAAPLGATAHAAEPATCAPPPAGLLLSQDFEAFPAGTPALAAKNDIARLFCPTASTISGFGNGAEPATNTLSGTRLSDRQGREAAGQFNGASSTVRWSFENVPGAQGQALRVLYPKGGNTSSHSGAQFEMPILGAKAYDRKTKTVSGTAHDELYLRYRVRFDEDFDWANGGKLPGLTANDAAGFPSDNNLVSARLMWRAEGKLEFYLHTDSDPRERLLWNNVPGAGHAQVTRGTWHTIEFRMKLNTPGQADGIWQGWLDGTLAGDYRDVNFRSSPDANLNSVYFSTFHGGSSGAGNLPTNIWWPSRDVRASFDDIQVSETPFTGVAGATSTSAGVAPVAPETIPTPTPTPTAATTTTPATTRGVISAEAWQSLTDAECRALQVGVGARSECSKPALREP